MFIWKHAMNKMNSSKADRVNSLSSLSELSLVGKLSVIFCVVDKLLGCRICCIYTDQEELLPVQLTHAVRY